MLSLAVLGPLLKPGYILALDSVYSLNRPFTNIFFGLDEWYPSASMPSDFIISLLNGIMPAWVWQKAVLVLIFFLAGWGAHRLCPVKGWPQYYAGILYMINPFTAARFFAGQWGLLAGYAVMPFAIKAFLGMLENGQIKNIIKVVIFTTLSGLFQIHTVFLLILVYSFLFAGRIISLRFNRTEILHRIKSAGIAAGLFLGLNLYWIVPALTASGTIVQQKSLADLYSFAPHQTSQFPVVFDLASMHGFWRAGYLYSQDVIPFYWLFFLFILYFALNGIISPRENVDLPPQKRGLAGWVPISFFIIAAIGLLLAMGVSVKFTRPVFIWLYFNIPFFSGFRDSQKFVALICLFYSYSGALGLSAITGTWWKRSKIARKVYIAITIVAILTPLVYACTIFGTWGQLKVTDYPRDWYAVNDYLNQDKADFNVLFLPWHHFMDYDWLPNKQKRLGDPAHLFFDKSVISGDNVELPNLYSQSVNPISKYMEYLLGKGSDIHNLGELLAPLNVKYVILVNESDYKIYDYLYRQDDLEVLLKMPDIVLFRNEQPTARVYGVDSVIYINNLDEYLEMSQSQNVMDHLYIIGDGEDNQNTGKMKAIDYIEESPVKYRIEESPSKYIIFTVPQNVSTRYWEYSGEKPLMNLGFMPAFASSQGGGEIVYKRFYTVYLPSDIISLAFLVVILYFLFSRLSLFPICLDCRRRSRLNYPEKRARRFMSWL